MSENDTETKSGADAPTDPPPPPAPEGGAVDEKPADEAQKAE